MNTSNYTKPSEIKPWLKTLENEITELENIECTNYEYLFEANKDRLDYIAINYLDTTVSYRALLKNTQQTARALKKFGVEKGDIITIVSIMTPELVYLFYALDLIGATPNLVDPRYSAEGIHEYITEVNSRFAVTISVAYERVAEACKNTNVEHLLVVTPVESLPKMKQFGYKLTSKDSHKYGKEVITWPDFFRAGLAGEDLVPEYDSNHACVICHTGGTTGSPKGVLLGDKALNAIAHGNKLYHFDEGRNFLDVMPPFIAYGYGCGVHAPLSIGLTTVIIPQFDPKDFGKYILKYKPIATAGVPSHYQTLVKDPLMQGKDLSFLVTTGAGGDAINTGAEQEVNDFLAQHNAPYKLGKGYGMTECCSQITSNILGHNKLGSVGTPMDLATVGIFEPGTDYELGFNEEGEICVAGPHLMLGYYNKPEATAEVLKMHSDGNIWLHTGDIGHMDEDGFIFISGRIKRVIIRHDGFKVFPTLIEDVVGAHPDVENCSAVRIKDADQNQGDLPIAFFTLKKTSTRNVSEVKAELKALCKEKLAEYVQPVDFILIDEIPLTSIGKIDYRNLEEKFVDTKHIK